MSTPCIAFPLFTENTWTSSDSKPSEVLTELPVSLRRLVSLLDENGEDDYGKIGPSQFAFKNAFQLVSSATSMVGEDVPSSPVVDSQGGIRVTWRQGDRQVKLVCPASRDSAIYIYQASGTDDSLLNQNVTASILAERLRWLLNRESAAKY